MPRSATKKTAAKKTVNKTNDRTAYTHDPDDQWVSPVVAAAMAGNSVEMVIDPLPEPEPEEIVHPESEDGE